MRFFPAWNGFRKALIERRKQHKSNGYTVLHKKNKLQVDGSHRLRFDAIRLQQLNL